MKKLLIVLLLTAVIIPVIAQETKNQETENMVRLSKITVDPERLAEYNAYLKEEI